ncbi:hypothetical protein HDU82_005998 [Entophlyctis luteolus]|nr:hypothetical protein HDU82_005998 [Entophlyctis luteolus]
MDLHPAVAAGDSPRSDEHSAPDYPFELMRIGAACAHIFHTTCLTQWAKVTRSCPVDRLAFVSVDIVVLQPEINSGGVDDDGVDGRAHRLAAYAKLSTRNIDPPSESISEESETFSDDEAVCTECGLQTEETVILCDGCDSAVHLSCAGLSPASIPEGDWLCRACSRPQRNDRPATRPAVNVNERVSARASRIQQRLRRIREEITRSHAIRMESLNIHMSLSRQYGSGYVGTPHVMRVGSVSSLAQSYSRKLEVARKQDTSSGTGEQVVRDSDGDLWDQFDAMKRKISLEANSRNSKKRIDSAHTGAATAVAGGSSSSSKKESSTLQQKLRSSPSTTTVLKAQPARRKPDTIYFCQKHANCPIESTPEILQSKANDRINSKERILRKVRRILDPLYQKRELSKEQYKEIARDATETVYNKRFKFDCCEDDAVQSSVSRLLSMQTSKL